MGNMEEKAKNMAKNTAKNTAKKATKQAIKLAMKMVLKLILSHFAVVAIPIAVLLIAISISWSIRDSSSSASSSEDEYENMSSLGTSIGADFIAGWEDSVVLSYLNGNITYSSSDHLKAVITEDKKYFICYTDGAGDRNYGYGICHYYPSGGYINVEHYESVGINIKESKYNNVGSSKIEVEKVLSVFEKEVNEKRNYVRSEAKKAGVTLKQNQIDALTAVAYQYGNIGNFFEMYKKYGDTESLKENAEARGATYSHYFIEVKPGGNENSRNRGEANWKLFHEGRYIIQGGKELDLNSYNSNNENNSNTLEITDNAKRNKIINLAKSKIGCKYVYGKKGPNEFDCSGFVYWIYKQNGITVPGSSDGYSSYKGSKKEIDIKDAKPGDILHIFKSERSEAYGHVAIYLDENTTIEAMGEKWGVCKGKVKGRFKRAFNLIDK